MIPEWRQIHNKATVFDIHAHPSLKLSLIGRLLGKRNPTAKQFNPFSVRTSMHNLREGNVDVLGSVIHVPEQELLDDCRLLRLVKVVLPRARRAMSGPRIEATLRTIDELEKEIDKVLDPKTGRPLAQVVKSVHELDVVLNQGDGAPIALVHMLEGAHHLGENVEHLDKLFARGVASVTLTHFYDNGFAPPVFPFPEYVQRFGCFEGDRDLTLGLSKQGFKLVERMLSLGMLIDITHCTPMVRRQVFDIVGTDAPLLASHVGAYEINPNPYNLENWEMERIADTGGVIGVIFMNYWLTPYERGRGIDFVSQTIRHVVSVTSAEHVSIGSDFDGFTDPPDDLKDASQLPYLTQRLLSDGFDHTQVEKILGGNALRALRKGWGKQIQLNPDTALHKVPGSRAPKDAAGS